MSKKDARMNVLRSIIANKRIRNQADLLNELRKLGIKLAQATLSRDLKALKVAKTATSDGGYIYVLPTNPLYRRTREQELPANYSMASGYISINFSNNIAVIHTRPGFASGLAYEIDLGGFYSIIGSLAGDDNILLVMREGAQRKELIDDLRTIIPEITMPQEG